MRLMLALVLSLSTVPAFAENYGYFNCMRLSQEQAQWFNEGAPVACCYLADAMPTLWEDREDGTYVPPYSEAHARAQVCREGRQPGLLEPDHSHWIRVPETAIKKNTNKVGVAVVWWTNTGVALQDWAQHTVKCFIGEIRS
jgi:hypothetical protein